MKSHISKVREILGSAVDSVGKTKEGTIVVRRGYFYRHGMDSGTFAENMKALLLDGKLDAVLVGCSDNWKPFNGGASVARQSHFAAEFKIYD